MHIKLGSRLDVKRMRSQLGVPNTAEIFNSTVITAAQCLDKQRVQAATIQELIIDPISNEQ